MVIDHYLCQKFSRVELTQQNSGKTSVLCEATRLLRDLLSQIECLKKEHATLLFESNYVRPLTISDRSLVNSFIPCVRLSNLSGRNISSSIQVVFL